MLDAIKVRLEDVSLLERRSIAHGAVVAPRLLGAADNSHAAGAGSVERLEDHRVGRYFRQGRFEIGPVGDDEGFPEAQAQVLLEKNESSLVRNTPGLVLRDPGQAQGVIKMSHGQRAQIGGARCDRTDPFPLAQTFQATEVQNAHVESLVGNKNSPLRKTLVDDLQLATSVRGSAYGRVLSGEYTLTIDLKPGVTPEDVLPIVDRIIAEYLESGPDKKIVENAKLGVNMYMIGALERSLSLIHI